MAGSMWDWDDQELWQFFAQLSQQGKAVMAVGVEEETNHVIMEVELPGESFIRVRMDLTDSDTVPAVMGAAMLIRTRMFMMLTAVSDTAPEVNDILRGAMRRTMLAMVRAALMAKGIEPSAGETEALVQQMNEEIKIDLVEGGTPLNDVQAADAIFERVIEAWTERKRQEQQ